MDTKNKVDVYMRIGKCLRCRNCLCVSKSGELCYFMECKHFICIKCFKQMTKNNNNKRKKEKNKIIACPFCGKELKKHGIALLNFSQNE